MTAKAIALAIAPLLLERGLRAARSHAPSERRGRPGLFSRRERRFFSRCRGGIARPLVLDPPILDKLALDRIFDHHQLYRERIEPETERWSDVEKSGHGMLNI